MRYVVTGRVQPERADVRFSPIEWKVPDQGRVVVQCHSSQITVLLDLTSTDGWETAYVQAEFFASMVISALGFSLGYGYSIEILQATQEDGTPHVIGVGPNGRGEPSPLGFVPHGPIFSRAFNLANQNVFFRFALRDFLRAIKDPFDCATYCYRAVESIKSAFVGGWNEMHAALDTNRERIDAMIKVYADPLRHGNWAEAPALNSSDRLQMLTLTREILLTYLNFASPEPNNNGFRQPEPGV
jgi:hypothetical protein